jgi:nitrite reductase/ring-hydroxylating ferredoxin subunit
MKPIKSPSRQSQSGKKISLAHALAALKLKHNGSVSFTHNRCPHCKNHLFGRQTKN